VNMTRERVRNFVHGTALGPKLKLNFRLEEWKHSNSYLDQK
jgi:hypothetical protein